MRMTLLDIVFGSKARRLGGAPRREGGEVQVQYRRDGFRVLLRTRQSSRRKGKGKGGRGEAPILSTALRKKKHQKGHLVCVASSSEYSTLQETEGMRENAQKCQVSMRAIRTAVNSI